MTKRLRSLLVTSLVLLATLGCTELALCKVIYANAARPDDAGDGLSWATAKQKIQSGISLCALGDQVWVAAGTYVGSVSLKSGVAVYGGFVGNGDT